jgi:hypothetical protein
VTTPATVSDTVRVLTDAVEASVRLDGPKVEQLVGQLRTVPFDLAAVTLALLLARRLQRAPGALLLGVQAEVAPATTPLRRCAGQLFLLAAYEFGRDEPADAPLAALQAMSRQVDPLQLLLGGVWALTVAARASSAAG